jgi:hypothetical protein
MSQLRSPRQTLTIRRMSTKRNGLNPTMKDSLRSMRSTSASMAAASRAAASRAHKSEYEHWKVTEITSGEGCQTGCSDGKQTVAAFGDVVTEVFDLINEVAFSEVIDLAAGVKEKDAHPACETVDSYEDDDDSIFNRSDDYLTSKNAKEFLGFIGAVKPNTKKIITTPAAPFALLTPDGIPLIFPPKGTSLTKVKTNEEAEKVESETRDDNSKKEDLEVDADDEKGTEHSRSQRSTSTRRRSPDRYSSLDGSNSSEEWSNGEDDDKNNEDWSDAKPKNRTEDDYKTASPDICDEPTSNPVVPFAQNGAARIKSAISQRFKQSFKRTKPKYSKPTSVCGPVEPELLTIVESSDEDTNASEEEYAREKEVPHGDKYEHEKEIEHIPEVETVEEVELEDKVVIIDEVEPEDEFECRDEHKEAEEDKTNEVGEENLFSSAVSGCTFSSYDASSEEEEDGDDRTYVSHTGSDDDSFLDLEELSATNHTKISMGIEDRSVTYSIGAEESLPDNSVTEHSNWVAMDESSYDDEETYDESVRRHTFSYGSSEYDDESDTEHKSSVAEELLNEEDESMVNENREISDAKLSTPPFVIPALSQFCSVYDNLYPSDSIFSFHTKDESLFDFSESNLEHEVQEPPPSILEDEKSLEAPPSFLTDTSSIDKNEDQEVLPGDEKIDAHQEEHEEEKDEVPQVSVEEEHDEEEIEENVDVQVLQKASDSNSNDPRDDVTEERDAVEGKDDEENEEAEAEAEDDEEVSQINSPFVSAINDETKQPTDSPQNTRVWPPPRHEAARDEAPATPTPECNGEESPETNSEEGEGKLTAKEEDSNSNRSCSNGSFHSTEAVEQANAKKEADNQLKSSLPPNPDNHDRQTSKRRQLSRIRMFNQHRLNILKLQQKAE